MKKSCAVCIQSSKMDLGYVTLAVKLIMSSLGIFLFGMTYTYIDKLERIGCVCSEHKHRRFLKVFPIVAIAAIVAIAVMPTELIAKAFGDAGVAVYSMITLLFGIACIVYFVMALLYTRWLIVEKCKCSEDVRRDVLFVWSVLEVTVIAALFLVPLVMPLAAGSLALVANTVGKAIKTQGVIRDAAVNPVGSMSKLSQSIRKNMRGRR